MNIKILSLLLAALACATPARAQRGSEIFRDQGCIRCHGFEGVGQDLRERLVVDYTVPALAAAVWNHTPDMWAEMSSTARRQPALTEADWEDVFRYLYLLQFSDRPALSRQGGEVFKSRCASCHDVGGPGKRVSDWARLDDPLALVFQMWTHASSMKKEFVGRRAWHRLSGTDLLDLTVYVQSVQKVPRVEQISLPNPADGRLLTAQHCGKCHGGSDRFAASMHNRTLMDIGAAAWNHVDIMETVPELSSEDFRKIVSYVWELQYRGPGGSTSRGEDVFRSKGCISCHRSPSGTAQPTPLNPRPGKTFTPLSMVALSWGAGRDMHRLMQEKGVRWPHLTPENVSDLVAYLNSPSGR